jgi:hypothetical protein
MNNVFVLRRQRAKETDTSLLPTMNRIDCQRELQTIFVVHLALLVTSHCGMFSRMERET